MKTFWINTYFAKWNSIWQVAKMYFGGINKGRPNEEDFKDAEEFAKNLKKTGLVF